MSIHNLCFTVKIRKMYTPVHPRYTILKWGVRGYTLHGHVILIYLPVFTYFHTPMSKFGVFLCKLQTAGYEFHIDMINRFCPF